MPLIKCKSFTVSFSHCFIVHTFCHLITRISFGFYVIDQNKIAQCCEVEARKISILAKLMGKENIHQRWSQEICGKSGGAAQIQSSGGRTCLESKCNLCTVQICSLWKRSFFFFLLKPILCVTSVVLSYVWPQLSLNNFCQAFHHPR